jgi:SAM-dependent methyltransferase
MQVTRDATMRLASGFIRRVAHISPQDAMFNWSRPLHYFTTGRSARRSIDQSLAAAGRREISRILDFGCGHGRVLRVLRRAFPDAQITAADIDRDGVAFCVRTFGAIGVHSSIDAASISFDCDFDLIWAGSVFTHIDKAGWKAFLALLRNSLAPDAVLVFSVHGPDVERKVRSGERTYSLEPATVASVLEHYAESGFGYGDYPGMTGYGISIVEPQAARALVEDAGLRLVTHIPVGWDNHQDIVACVRAG